MNPRHKVYLWIIAVLVVLYVLYYGVGRAGLVVTGGRLSQQAAKVKQLRNELADLERNRQQYAQMRQTIMGLARNYWVVVDQVPVNEIQTQIERLGTQTGVKLVRLGAPRVVEINPHLRAVEVQISSTSTIEALGKFLEQVDQQRPMLEWTNFTARPNRPVNPTQVVMSGKLRALLLAKSELEGQPPAAGK